ncbi:MAG: hypothetical protein WC520_00350 [Candidatus Paceibacterota bacterium]
MVETRQEKEERRRLGVAAATAAAERKINDWSDGSKEEAALIRADVIKNLMQKELEPFAIKLADKDMRDEANEILAK